MWQAKGIKEKRTIYNVRWEKERNGERGKKIIAWAARPEQNFEVCWAFPGEPFSVCTFTLLPLLTVLLRLSQSSSFSLLSFEILRRGSFKAFTQSVPNLFPRPYVWHSLPPTISLYLSSVWSHCSRNEPCLDTSHSAFSARLSFSKASWGWGAHIHVCVPVAYGTMPVTEMGAQQMCWKGD